MTVSQVRWIFSELLRPTLRLADLASKVSEQLRRNEESRIYAHHGATGLLPLPREPDIQM